MPRKPLTEEQRQRRVRMYYTRRIRRLFSNLGFEHVATEGINHKFGNVDGELDSVFLYENVIVVCEETTATNKVRDHLTKKSLVFSEIERDKSSVIDWLKSLRPEKFEKFDQYPVERYVLRFLYFSKEDIVPKSGDKELFSPAMVVRPPVQEYFQKLASNIRRSGRSELFRYLEIKRSEIGYAGSATAPSSIDATIIFPSGNTGLPNGVQLVSFMMSANMLMNNCYVLRKDNWEQSTGLYQRLIEKDRIQGIRGYLARKQSTFINNIIVGLPNGVVFRDGEGKSVELSTVADFGSLQMQLPDEANSICVIDGQHRIFAHYEGVDGHEKVIALLRKKLHLLVTGLVYPEKMSDFERRRFESELFLDINSNARPVPSDVLLYIETLKDPFSEIAVARQVLEVLNSRAPFEGMFQMSLLDSGKIKIASIVKFALRYLVAIDADAQRPTLFHTWGDDAKRDALLEQKNSKNDDALLKEYVEYCASHLASYFGALRRVRAADWKDRESKILSTTSLNGFIIALRRSLGKGELRDFDAYVAALGKLSTKFGRADFDYASSQYGKFSVKISAEVFEDE